MRMRMAIEPMFEKAPIGNLFVPGKVIPIRHGSTIEHIAFIEVQEHVRHVKAIMDFLYPHADEKLRSAACCHDIGKKFLNNSYSLALQEIIGKNRKNLTKREQQLKDYWGQQVNGEITPTEAFLAFLDYSLKTGEGGSKLHLKIWTHKDNLETTDETVRYSYKFDPPFSHHHAMDVGGKDLLQGPADVNQQYLLEMVHLHHSFQIDKIVEAAAEYGDAIITDLHHLMVCDHFGSQCAEQVVQFLENGEVFEWNSGMRFAEFEIIIKENILQIKREEPHIHGQITLVHDSRSLDLDVHYFVFDFHFDGAEDTARLIQRKKGGRK